MPCEVGGGDGFLEPCDAGVRERKAATDRLFRFECLIGVGVDRNAVAEFGLHDADALEVGGQIVADSDLHRPKAHLGEALCLTDECVGGIAEPEAGRCVGVDPVGDRTPHAVERKPDRLCGGVPHCGVDRRETSDGDTLVSGGVDRTPDVGPDTACFEDRTADGELGKPVHHLVERSDSGAVNRETEAFTGDPVGGAHRDEHTTDGFDLVDRCADRARQRDEDDLGRDVLDQRTRVVHDYCLKPGSSRSQRRTSAGHSYCPSGKWSYWRFESSQISFGPGSSSSPEPAAASSARQPRIR